MPGNRTHAIHGEMIYPHIPKMTDINIEYLKAYCMGPDPFLMTDRKLFNDTHSSNTRLMIKTLIKLIKQHRLQDDPETMTFLYGQLDHYILDAIMHPLIVYMTSELPREHLMDPHAIIENQIDDYVMDKFDRKDEFYFHKDHISNHKLIKIVDNAYERVYHAKNASIKYSRGMFLLGIYDSLIRRNKFFLANAIMKLINLGDISFHNDYKKVLPYLNLEHNIWLDPETGEIHRESFDNLWDKAIEIALETINDVNLYIYYDKRLKNPFIDKDISLDTGQPCRKGQTKKFVKKYIKRR